MPQFLHLVANQCLLGTIRTGHTGSESERSTVYDVHWMEGDHPRHEFQNVDTGIPCQPLSPVDCELDFKDDFIHARRAIAAACATAEDLFHRLSLPRAREQPFSEMEIYLRTNQFDRGAINIRSIRSESIRVSMAIGTGPIRLPGTSPAEVFEWSCESSLPNGHSPLGIALLVLASEGPKMVRALESHIR